MAARRVRSQVLAFRAVEASGDDDELVTSDAGDQGPVGCGLHQAVGDGPQYLIADPVAP